MDPLLSGWESLGIINACGFSTRVGGSCPAPEVVEAMAAAQGRYFEIDDLLELAANVISRETGGESGIVTCGAAAALTLGGAALLSGFDIDVMERLPLLGSLVRDEFLYPVTGYYDYDHPLRVTGARLREFSFDEPDLEARLKGVVDERTAGVVYVWKHRNDSQRIELIANTCRAIGVPFLVDAAMALPPHGNLKGIMALGPNLVALSGGKHLGGPQNSGLLFGDKSLIQSAWLQMVDMDVRPTTWSLGELLDNKVIPRPPRHGLGRGFKVGKDAIMGCLTALAAYESRDFAAEARRWHEICRKIEGALGGASGFTVEYLQENGTGQYPTVRLTASSGTQMTQLKHDLKAERPKIILAEHEDEESVSYIYPLCLSDEEVGIVIERVSEAMRK